MTGVPTVTTPSGVLVGRSADGVDAYLGIPFGRVPGRFQPPLPVSGWTGARPATAFGPSAPQPVGGPFAGLVPGMTVVSQDEDCLSLNVWAPRGAAGAPVLVWLHGGAFTIGGSSLGTYDATRLAAEQQVVVVSPNYRLGALGFLAGLPGVAPNCGLRDQLLALRWVQDHVAAFGGDPGNVTVLGESAGAGSVLHLMTSPHAEGLLHKAIAHSPGVAHTLDADTARVVAQALVTALDGADPASVPLERLLAGQQQAAAALAGTVGAMPFHPCVDGDVIPATPSSPGALAAVPLLAGTTAEEMRLFADPALAGLDHAALAAVLLPLLSAAAGHPLDPAVVAGVVAAYAADGGDGADVFAAVATDHVMRLPLADLLDVHAAVAPTYAWSFTWRATGAPRDVGACHAVDLPFLFGTFDREGWGAWVGDEDQAEGLSRAVRTAWAAFARTGSPTAKELPDWPRYDGQQRLTMLLGRTVELAADPLETARTRCAPLRRRRNA